MVPIFFRFTANYVYAAYYPFVNMILVIVVALFDANLIGVNGKQCSCMLACGLYLVCVQNVRVNEENDRIGLESMCV